MKKNSDMLMCYLSSELKEAIKEVARKEEVSMASIVRKSIKVFIKTSQIAPNQNQKQGINSPVLY